MQQPPVLSVIYSSGCSQRRNAFSKLTADKFPPGRSRSSRWSKVSARRRSSRLMSSVAWSQHREASLLWRRGVRRTEARCSCRLVPEEVWRVAQVDALILNDIADLGNQPSECTDIFKTEIGAQRRHCDIRSAPLVDLSAARCGKSRSWRGGDTCGPIGENGGLSTAEARGYWCHGENKRL